MRYRRKPTEIEAVQLRWSTWNELLDFVGNQIGPDNPGWAITEEEASDTCGEVGPDYIAIKLMTAHGDMTTFRHGDWVIPDSKPGTFYPCKPDVFAATYDSVTD